MQFKEKHLVLNLRQIYWMNLVKSCWHFPGGSGKLSLIYNITNLGFSSDYIGSNLAGYGLRLWWKLFTCNHIKGSWICRHGGLNVGFAVWRMESLPTVLSLSILTALHWKHASQALCQLSSEAGMSGLADCNEDCVLSNKGGILLALNVILV